MKTTRNMHYKSNMVNFNFMLTLKHGYVFKAGEVPVEQEHSIGSVGLGLNY